MKANLFVNYYLDAHGSRQDELDLAVRRNIENELIDMIMIFCNKDACSRLVLTDMDMTKVRFRYFDGRPTFNDLFLRTTYFPNDINIIANTDIYFDDTLQLVKDYDWKENTCMALARWDLQLNGRLEHFNRQDSNDSWIFKGLVPEIPGADFTLGKPGCDNKILYLLLMSGYHIINPSLSIKTIHMHQSGIRNYTHADILPPPYHFVIPTAL